ncbi:hypothetical protein ACXR6G_11835 [Ancylomarina sp. YFZ004]
METKNLTPEESFNIINKAIGNFKMNYKENATVFLLWGWVLSLASFSHFIILKILKGYEAHELKLGNWELTGLFSIGNWFLFSLIGFIILFFMERKTNKKKKVYSHLDSYIKNLWYATAAGFFVAIFLCFKLDIVPPALMLLIAGIATTTTGLFIKFKPLMFGGIAFFIFSIASTFVLNENIALIVGLAIVCGYLIPGYLLKSAK